MAYSIAPISFQLDEKDWLAGELSVNSLRGKVLIDTGARVNITTMNFAKEAGAKITVGPKIRMIFADGRESVCNLQSEMEFKIGEVRSKASFRLITNLLPGVDVILEKAWLKETKPTIDFESGAVQVNGLHALDPKAESLSPTPISATDLLALATILATAVATSAITPGKSTSIPLEFQQFAGGIPPASVYVKPAVEPPAVYVSVVGAKAMHKTLKGNNELTALLFVGAADDQAASGGATPVHPALKWLVSQFQDSVLTSELRKGVPESKLTHKIDLVDRSDPPGQRPFRLSAAEATEISKQLTELINLGLIRPSLSDFGAPILLVKKDNTFRMCIDYRRLNAITIIFISFAND